MMQSNIVLMGPIGVGKTTIGKEVAKQLGKSFIDLDDQRDRYYSETPYSNQKAELQYMLRGIMGWYYYQKPYELYSVKRVLQENSNAVIAFGGGQSVYEDEKQIEEFLSLMKPVENSFLLLPYPNIQESLAFLSARTDESGAEMNRLFISADSSRMAAKHTLYTGDKTLCQIVEEIIGQLT